jgi:microcystin-dependent protein
MSTLQVANLHLESTGNNRVQFVSSSLAIVAGGANTIVANSTVTQLIAGGTTAATINSTAANFASPISVQNKIIAEVPTGSLMPYAGTTAPTNWLFCFGQAVSRTTYADLFSALSTTYGSGDGSTTFNLPDLRGRAVAGRDDMGGTAANRLTNQSGGVNGLTLGAGGGAETHTLTEAQLAAHTHTTPTSDGTTAFTTGGATQPASNINGVTGSTGSGSAHNNVQPTIILNYIIKI